MEKLGVLPILGLSPRNSYYNAENIGYVIDKVVADYGRAFIMVADIPDIENLLAFGCTSDQARDAAKKDANELKRHVREHCQARSYTWANYGHSDAQVRIIDWAMEVESSKIYEQKKADVLALYNTNPHFRKEIRQMTRAVIERRVAHNETTKRRIKKQGDGILEKGIDFAIDQAKNYILSEFAFLEMAPTLFGGKFAQYVYHRDWPVYEQYISNEFDRATHSHLGFQIVDKASWPASEKLPDNILRVAYSDYPPGMYRDLNGEYKGIFFDLLKNITRSAGFQFEIMEKEVGYDMAVQGLNDGRYDIFCSPTWNTDYRRLNATLTDPIFTSEVGLWVNPHHPLADLGLDGLRNNESARELALAIKNLDVTEHYAAQFPGIRRINTPANTAIVGLLERVTHGRAMGTFVEPALVKWCAENRALNGDVVNVGVVDVAANHFLLASGSRGAQLALIFNEALKNLRQKGFIHDRVKFHTGREDTFGFHLPMPPEKRPLASRPPFLN